MGWNYEDDGFSKVNMYFTTLEDAEEYCINMGI